MHCLAKSLSPFRHLRRGSEACNPAPRLVRLRFHSTMSEDPKLGDLLDYLEKLKNYERLGVPRGAGTDSEDGFDLGRMRRLLRRLGDPHTHFQAVHITGTKGKGSTAAYLSNILRKEGYSVGCYTSPHILTIRERISLGTNGDPISSEALRNLFHQVKGILDQSIELENGALSHFEVFTALAFSAFSQEKVDIAIIEAGLGGARDATNVLRSTELAASVITSIGEEHLTALGGSLESIAMAKSGIIKNGRPKTLASSRIVGNTSSWFCRTGKTMDRVCLAINCTESAFLGELVIGGPFKLQIEHMLRNKASSMNSPVVSACDPGIHSVVKCFGREVDKKPYQICDILIQVQDDFLLCIGLHDVKLQMLGNHQLKNAVTATCTALCLRDQGWSISDESIRAGLERTQLLGRSQFLTGKEAEAVGLPRASILVDGAHTEASARGLADIITMANPDGRLALVVAMASDKDHTAFARQLLSGERPEIVLLTEVGIAGGKSRTASASALKDAWIRTTTELGIKILDIGMIEHNRALEGHFSCLREPTDHEPRMVIGCDISSVDDSMKVADWLLRSRGSSRSGYLIVVTGSLHIVASVIASTHQ